MNVMTSLVVNLRRAKPRDWERNHRLPRHGESENVASLPQHAARPQPKIYASDLALTQLLHSFFVLEVGLTLFRHFVVYIRAVADSKPSVRTSMEEQTHCSR